jgi:putative addiction module CopG family antidote
MNAVTLPPDLERFADEAVAKGRFRDVNEVVRAGLTLLQQSEAELVAFAGSLDAAKAEGERVGFRRLDQVMRDADALLEEMIDPRL